MRSREAGLWNRAKKSQSRKINCQHFAPNAKSISMPFPQKAGLPSRDCEVEERKEVRTQPERAWIVVICFWWWNAVSGGECDTATERRDPSTPGGNHGFPTPSTPLFLFPEGMFLIFISATRVGYIEGLSSVTCSLRSV